jgi:hypothetical protein
VPRPAIARRGRVRHVPGRRDADRARCRSSARRDSRRRSTRWRRPRWESDGAWDALPQDHARTLHRPHRHGRPMFATTRGGNRRLPRQSHHPDRSHPPPQPAALPGRGARRAASRHDWVQYDRIHCEQGDAIPPGGRQCFYPRRHARLVRVRLRRRCGTRCFAAHHRVIHYCVIHHVVPCCGLPPVFALHLGVPGLVPGADGDHGGDRLPHPLHHDRRPALAERPERRPGRLSRRTVHRRR